MVSYAFLCIHGYGMRQEFWQIFQQLVLARGHQCICPTLSMESPEKVLVELSLVIKNHLEFCQAQGLRSVIIGHSLGAVFLSLATYQLIDTAPWPDLVVLLSPPFGHGRSADIKQRIVRLLLRWRLLPQSLIRRRFFGPDVPVHAQKALFSHKVSENSTMRQLIMAQDWFHTNLCQAFPAQYPGIVLASAGDRIVKPTRSQAMAQALNFDFRLIGQGRSPGHDDCAAWKAAAEQLLTAICLADNRLPKVREVGNQ